MFRASVRQLSTTARTSLKIGLIPADGVGREVIPVREFSLATISYANGKQAAKTAIEALGSDIPKPEFIDLLAGWDTFTRTGVALPQETVEYASFVTLRGKIAHNFSLVFYGTSAIALFSGPSGK